MNNFDPNSAIAPDAGLFGLPFSEKDAALVLLPVPWEATTSYGGGTSAGPEAIVQASHQLDLFDLDVENPYAPGIYMLPISAEIAAMNQEAKTQAQLVIEAAGIVEGNEKLESALAKVNRLSAKLNDFVFTESKRLMDDGKIVGIVGGDHSVPFGAIAAAAERFPAFGILHIDAHSDTRDAYEGFLWSHASIFHNVLEKIPAVTKLVQVGIRDFCVAEFDYTKAQGQRVDVFFDTHLERAKLSGKTWRDLALKIVECLPPVVWVSVDIDGLDPRFCPNTGTPVPGGLSFHELNFVLRLVAESGRKIIGFDLCEVAPDPEGKNEWDANVGARLLYKLCGLTLASQGHAALKASASTL